MTNNGYWIYLEQLRKSGAVNMFGAVPYLKAVFGLTEFEARSILLEWMSCYNPEDYESEAVE